MPAVSLVIPIYNEEESLQILCEKLKTLSLDWEAIMVNDGSADKSPSILKELAKTDQRIKVISFNRNYGQTAALAAGFQAASAPVIIPLDADLQNDPADIPMLLAKMSEGYDVVSGWRKNRQDKSLSRILPSRIANWLISRITGVKLHDYGCTLKAYKAEIIKEVRLYGEMHRFIPAYAAWHGAKVTEVVVNHHPRQFGQTKYGISRTFRVILDLLTVKFLTSYSTKPMHFFGTAGFMSIGLSFITGLWALVLKILGIRSFSSTPLLLITLIFFMLGVQFILMGLLAEMLMRNYYEHKDKQIYSIKEKINFEN